MKQIKRWGLLVLLSALLGLFFYFDLYRYLSFDSLKMHRMTLIDWTHEHFVQTILAFMLIYIVAVAISIPGAIFLTLIAGFLFGPIYGTLAVIISATLGAFIVFIAVELALREWVIKKHPNGLKSCSKVFRKMHFLICYFYV